MANAAASPIIASRPCSISFPGENGPNAPLVLGSAVYFLACASGMNDASATSVETNAREKTWSWN